jgi:excisionase family DNA binding protein
MPKAKDKHKRSHPVTSNGVADVLTLTEAAQYLRLPEAEVLRLVQDQGLPARQVGSHWRFFKDAVQQWLSSGAPTLEARKYAQLALAGKYKDDDDLIRICEEAYRQRRSV